MMERVRHLDYTDPALSEGASDWTCENGGCTDAPYGGSNSYGMTMNIEALDDLDNANAPRKRITMVFRPRLSASNANGQEQYWANNPVRVVVVRSAPGNGPYQQ